MNPVKRTRKRRCHTGILACDITKEMLAQWFHLPSHEACSRLGISLSVLKRVCRKQGISRWPYRALSTSTTQSEKHPHKQPTSSQSHPLTPPSAGNTTTTSNSTAANTDVTSKKLGLSPLQHTASSGGLLSSPGRVAKRAKQAEHQEQQVQPDSSPKHKLAQRLAESPAREGGANASGLDTLLAAAATVEPRSAPTEATSTAPCQDAAELQWSGSAQQQQQWGKEGSWWEQVEAGGNASMPLGLLQAFNTLGAPQMQPCYQPMWCSLPAASLSLDPPSPSQLPERPLGFKQEQQAAAAGQLAALLSSPGVMESFTEAQLRMLPAVLLQQQQKDRQSLVDRSGHDVHSAFQPWPHYAQQQQGQRQRQQMPEPSGFLAQQWLYAQQEQQLAASDVSRAIQDGGYAQQQSALQRQPRPSPFCTVMNHPLPSVTAPQEPYGLVETAPDAAVTAFGTLASEAASLLQLLQKGFSVIQSQPTHPLAEQLATAMRGALQAVVLSAELSAQHGGMQAAVAAQGSTQAALEGGRMGSDIPASVGGCALQDGFNLAEGSVLGRMLRARLGRSPEQWRPQ